LAKSVATHVIHHPTTAIATTTIIIILDRMELSPSKNKIHKVDQF
jgi:hypothetical protein